MGVMIKDGDSGEPQDIHKYLHPDDYDETPKEEEEYPGLMPRSSDYKKEWYRVKCKGAGVSKLRDNMTKYQNNYYQSHKDRINARRRALYKQRHS